MLDAEQFFSQQVSHLDAVSEVDSQKGATPFNQNGLPQTSAFAMKKDQPSTPREQSQSVMTQQVEPSNFRLNKHRSDMTNNTANKDRSSSKPKDQFSPMQMPQRSSAISNTDQDPYDINKSFGAGLRKD